MHQIDKNSSNRPLAEVGREEEAAYAYADDAVYPSDEANRRVEVLARHS
jgi:hypothetical protein